MLAIYISFLSFFLLFIPACSNKQIKHPLPLSYNKRVLRESAQQQVLEPIHAETESDLNTQEISSDTVTSANILREYEARLFDITPFWGAQLKRGFKHCDEKLGMQWLLEYEVASDIQMVRVWYDQQLEYAGWVRVQQVDAFTTLMLFKKPSKLCQITLQTNELRNTTILVWVFEVSSE